MFGTICQLLANRAARQTRPGSNSRRARLGCEQLEERALMAGDVANTMEAAPYWNLTDVVATKSAIHAPTDVDMYEIRVKNVSVGGELIAIDIDRPQGSGLDSYLRLFDANGREIDANNDGVAWGEKQVKGDAHIVRKFNIGTYYVGVSSWTNQSYSPSTGRSGGTVVDLGNTTGIYSLTIKRHGNDINDEIDEAQSLGAMTLRRAVNGTLMATDTQPGELKDVDMYGFTVTAGQRIAFDADLTYAHAGHETTWFPDTYLRIFDQNGVELKRNNNGLAPDETKELVQRTESYIEHTFATGGTYFVGVSANPNDRYDPVKGTGDVMGLYRTGSYKLILTPIAEDGDDQTSEAHTLQWTADWWGVPLTHGSLKDGADVSMYKVTISQSQGAQKIGFDVGIPSGGTLSPYLRLFDANGRQIASSSGGDGHQWTKDGIRYTRKVQLDVTLAPGTYYVGVSVLGNNKYDAVTGKGDAKIAGGGKFNLYANGLGAVQGTNQPV
jgi:hypothetical protein